MSFEIQDIWEGERVSARSNLPIASKIPETKNIYCIGGLGSRGLSYAPFLAEIVSSAIQDKQIPLSKEIFSFLRSGDCSYVLPIQLVPSTFGIIYP